MRTLEQKVLLNCFKAFTVLKETEGPSRPMVLLNEYVEKDTCNVKVIITRPLQDLTEAFAHKEVRANDSVDSDDHRWSTIVKRVDVDEANHGR